MTPFSVPVLDYMNKKNLSWLFISSDSMHNTMSQFVHALWYQCVVGNYTPFVLLLHQLAPLPWKVIIVALRVHSEMNWSIVERLCLRMGHIILWPLVLDYILKWKSEVRTSIYAFIDCLIIIEICDQFLQTLPVLTSLLGWSVICYHALQ